MNKEGRFDEGSSNDHAALYGGSINRSRERTRLGNDAPLDEKVVEIRISAFESWDEMNGDTLFSFKEAKAVSAFEEAIRTARKQPDVAKRTDPDYDVMVIYDQQSPIHAIKLWLGKRVRKVCLATVSKIGEKMYMWFPPNIRIG